MNLENDVIGKYVQKLMGTVVEPVETTTGVDQAARDEKLLNWLK